MKETAKYEIRVKRLSFRKANQNTEFASSNQSLSQISLPLVFHSVGTIGEDYSVNEVANLPRSHAK